MVFGVKEHGVPEVLPGLSSTLVECAFHPVFNDKSAIIFRKSVVAAVINYHYLPLIAPEIRSQHENHSAAKHCYWLLGVFSGVSWGRGITNRDSEERAAADVFINGKIIYNVNRLSTSSSIDTTDSRTLVEVFASPSKYSDHNDSVHP